MARIRKIRRQLAEGRNYFLVDANFLVNKYIPPTVAPNDTQKRRIDKCLEWWGEIDSQLSSGKARVYICDLCIAEAFKVLAQKYYVDRWFPNSHTYNYSKKRLISEITTTSKDLSKFDRKIRYHDISTSRDLIIAVDRFFEVFLKNNLKVSLTDLVILATAKYLVDFYDIPTNRIHIITLDRHLRRGAKYIQELPYIYDPTDPADERSKVFVS
jgi:predicted nucleic acid-binding protein